MERAGDVPSVLMANAQAATSRVEEIARRAFYAGFPGPSVVRPERPQAVWGVLKSAATLTNRSGEGASCCALYGRRASKHGPRGPEAVVGSGDESSRANATKLRPSLSAVKANQNR